MFISVAESIVILPPIAQVGCASACSTVTCAQLGRGPAAERPARGGEDQPVDRAGTLAGQQLMQRRVLGVDRDDRRPGRLGKLHDELAADDERLLVGEREVDPLTERRDRRHEAGRTDDRVEHEIAPGFGDQLDEPVRAGQHLSVGPRLRRRAPPRPVGQRDPPHAERLRLLEQRLPGAAER